MAYLITLYLKVDSLKTKADAADFANDLTTHILESFNDDSSIRSDVEYNVAKIQGRD